MASHVPTKRPKRSASRPSVRCGPWAARTLTMSPRPSAVGLAWPVSCAQAHVAAPVVAIATNRAQFPSAIIEITPLYHWTLVDPMGGPLEDSCAETGALAQHEIGACRIARHRGCGFPLPRARRRRHLRGAESHP